MPFRGRFSKGCENCRKAKRRCDLGQPECLRCKRAGKTCTGYRDTTAVRILDETEHTRLKFTRPRKLSSTSSEQKAASPTEDVLQQMALSYFFETFATENSKWEFLRTLKSRDSHDELLESAMQACGLAAMTTAGQDGGSSRAATAIYGRTMSQLQAALADSTRQTSDSVLITVALLACYENVLCHDIESIRSWRMHTGGTAQLLKLRGKAQLQTVQGRMLYRICRTHVIADCIWDDLEPPPFLLRLNEDLQMYHIEDGAAAVPLDELHSITLDLAHLRCQMRSATAGTDTVGKEILAIRSQLAEWPVKTSAVGTAWRCNVLHEQDPPRVWNGTAYMYASHMVASTWNVYRALTIMVARAQELFSAGQQHNGDAAAALSPKLWEARQQIVNEVCYTLPCQLSRTPGSLDHDPACSMAFEAVWPCFYAASEALALVEHYTVRLKANAEQYTVLKEKALSSAAQASWLIDRLMFISEDVGVKWADRFLAILHGQHDISDLVSPSSTSTLRKSKLVLDRDRHPIESALQSLNAAV